MPRLKSRTHQIPNGNYFHQPETGWTSPRWMSHDALTKAVITHRLGNPAIARKHRLAVDYDAVANEVDNFLAQICLSHNWNDFIIGGGEFPKMNPLSWRSGAAAAAGGVKKTLAGVNTLKDWLGDGLRPVAAGLAEQRAAICAACPKNQDGNFWQKLDAAAAATVKTLLAVRSDMALKTSLDDKLKSCQACDCWLPLKVFAPLKHIKPNTSAEVIAKLDEKCWIIHEK